MLFSARDDYAITYLSGQEKEVSRMHHTTQLLLVQMIRKRCRARPEEKPQWLVFIQRLIGSSSLAVKYECAKAMLLISSQPKIVQAVVECFVKIYTTAVCLPLPLFLSLLIVCCCPTYLFIRQTPTSS
jgi:coatomer subunit beta